MYVDKYCADFLFGLLLGSFFSKLRLPSLLGMIIVGIILGPNALNWIDESILSISGELRQIALVIILTRAGLSLNISDLKEVGRSAVLMCFLSACAEILGIVLFAPKLLPVSTLEAAIIGSVTVAVLSILSTAPFGAICIDHLHKNLLDKDVKTSGGWK